MPMMIDVYKRQIQLCEDIGDLVTKCDAVMIAVKPKDVRSVSYTHLVKNHEIIQCMMGGDIKLAGEEAL